MCHNTGRGTQYNTLIINRVKGNSNWDYWEGWRVSKIMFHTPPFSVLTFNKICYEKVPLNLLKNQLPALRLFKIIVFHCVHELHRLVLLLMFSCSIYLARIHLGDQLKYFIQKASSVWVLHLFFMAAQYHLSEKLYVFSPGWVSFGLLQLGDLSPTNSTAQIQSWFTYISIGSNVLLFIVVNVVQLFEMVPYWQFVLSVQLSLQQNENHNRI